MKQLLRRTALAVIACAAFASVFMLAPEVAHAWGFWGHQRLNRLAVFTLPPEMIVFYKKNLEYVTEHAVDPDKRRYAVEGEDKNHYIDIDVPPYGENAMETMPRYWNDAVEMFSEDTLREYGILPWNLENQMYALTRAFESKDVQRILKYSSDLGHYVGDGHVPLHTTVNYNGQLTGQRGIHGFWESRIPEMFGDRYNYFVGKAEYIEDVNAFIWNFIAESHARVDSVLRLERELHNRFPDDQKYSFEQRGAAGMTTRVYSAEYTAAYDQLIDGMVESRMRSAVKSIGSLWFTAWVNAGQPDLSGVGFYELSEEEIKARKELEKQFNQGEIKGRTHDR